MTSFSKRFAAMGLVAALAFGSAACPRDDDDVAPSQTTTTQPDGSSDAPQNGNQAPDDVNPNNPSGDDATPPQVPSG